MTDRQRPHYVWITVVAVGAAVLAGVAWWLWSTAGDAGGQAAPSSEGAAAATDPGGPAGPGTAEAPGRAEQARAGRERAARAIEERQFVEASRQLDALEKKYGWTTELATLRAGLELREALFRSAPRPIEFRIESLDTTRTGLFARFSVEDTVVFVTENLALNPDKTDTASRTNLVTLRTSLNAGATVEILEKGGLFGGDEIVLGPVSLAPLTEPGGGRLEFRDADAQVSRLAVRYRPSPFVAGVHPDTLLTSPPPDATPSDLIDFATRALALDDLASAEEALTRLGASAPTSPDVAFLGERIAARRESLKRNRTTARFSILELCADPRAGTSPWATGGDAPSFKCSIRSASETLATTEGGATAPFLVPDDVAAPPTGNLLRVTARGEDKLSFVVTDTSPTFGSREVGRVELPKSLGELPRGSGLMVIEREPTVLVLPASDANRLRRVVLRWTVER